MLRRFLAYRNINIKLAMRSLFVKREYREIAATVTSRELAIANIGFKSYPIENTHLVNGGRVNEMQVG